MRYAKIDEHEIVNGEKNGMSLYVQGCHFRCHKCFNSEIWDFGGGKDWTEDVKNDFIRLTGRPYIKRVSILGGEPLADENSEDVLELIREIRQLYPDKTIWLYSGYTWDAVMYPVITAELGFQINESFQIRKQIISLCDVFIDGRYIESKRDITLKWRGSSNQRVINIKNTLEEEKIVLWAD